jgi:hypothetical protein
VQVNRAKAIEPRRSNQGDQKTIGRRDYQPTGIAFEQNFSSGVERSVVAGLTLESGLAEHLNCG